MSTYAGGGNQPPRNVPRPAEVNVTRAELELRTAELGRELIEATGAAIAALRRELLAELAGVEADLTRRIDKVHTAALRAMTDRINGGD